MARTTSLVAITDDSVDSDLPVPMANVLTYEELVEQAAAKASDGSVGTGAEQVDESELAGQPFVIVAIHINEGDYGDFGSFECRLPDQRLVVFNDGSTGVFKQFVTEDGEIKSSVRLPMYCANGLRASEYDTVDCPNCNKTQARKSRRTDYQCRYCQKMIPAAQADGKATTYYLDTRGAKKNGK